MKKVNQLANSSHQPLILIADDDGAARFLLCCILQQNDYQVIEAEDGAQALTEHQEDMIGN